jgi:hypothetical protein
MFALSETNRTSRGEGIAGVGHLVRHQINLGRFALLGVALFAVTSLPVMAAHVPSLVDYVNHLARIYIIANDGRDAALSQYYAVHWALIPNLSMDLVVPPLVRVLGIYAAGKLFLLVIIALLVTGPHAIYHALYRRFSSWPFVACLFIYNDSFSGGLTSYLFGVGVALWGVAAWISLTRAHVGVRVAVSSAFILVLYLCHLAAAGIYLIAVASFELWRAYSDVRTYRRRLVLNLAPLFLAMVVVLLLHHFQPGSVSHQVLRWTVAAKIRGITWTFESEQMFRLADALISATVITGIAGFAWWRGILRCHPAGVPLLVASIAAFLAAPSEIMGASGVDSRLPIAFLFVVIGFLDWNAPSARQRGAFLLALALLLASRIGVVEYAWRAMAVDTADMEQSAAAIKRGGKVLVARGDHPSYRAASWLYYLPCLMMIERSALVSLAYSDPTQQVLAVKPPFRDMAGGFNDDPPSLSELTSPPTTSPSSPSGRIYWNNWQKNYDYVYLVSLNGESPSVPSSLKEIYEAHHFRLYAVVRPPAATLSR